MPVTTAQHLGDSEAEPHPPLGKAGQDTRWRTLQLPFVTAGNQRCLFPAQPALAPQCSSALTPCAALRSSCGSITLDVSSLQFLPEPAWSIEAFGSAEAAITAL